MVINQEIISKVEELSPFEDEYVYDLMMRDPKIPYFFANDILVHNSCYFVMENLVGDNIEDAIQCADGIVCTVNDTFPEFMRLAFFCQPGFDSLISANREVVASAGIFRAKKKYMLLARDIEGKRIDVDSKKALKTQGSDIKISSTPEAIRSMLKTVLMMILTSEDTQKITDFIIEFRRNFNNADVRPLDYATITSVKNLEEYGEKWERIESKGMGKVNLPGNVRAAINHNKCLEVFEDNNTQAIISGSKIKIIWLKENSYNFKSMAFGSDTEELPKWFTDNFEIDTRLTETKLIDQKLLNIYEPIGWQVPTEHTVIINKLLSFD
jgi:hypothetical protein